MTYPRSRRVVLGHSPSSGYEPFFGRVSSSSSRRLDSLYHDWPDQAVGANVWWRPEDRDLPDKSHLNEVLKETQCKVVVALGHVVARHIGIETPRLLGVYDIGVHINVLVFPHPSGVNRFWNDYNNRVRAADALKEALLS